MTGDLDWWLLGLALVVVAAVALLVLPVKVVVSLQARGEPDGGYAIAGGGQVGPFATTFVMARQVPVQLDVRVFGRRLLQRQRPAKALKEAASGELSGWLKRRLDPVDVALFLLDERRRIALDRLDIDIDYSFKNVALTGQLLAALCALSAVLPPRVQLHQHPSWDLAGRATLSLDGRLRVWPGLFIIDTLRFLRQATIIDTSEVGTPQGNSRRLPPGEHRRPPRDSSTDA